MINNNYFIILLFLSCNLKAPIGKTYYVSGNLQKLIYGAQKDIDSVVFYYDSVKRIVFKKVIRKTDYDSIKVYYKNGNLFKEGKRSLNGLKFGNWLYYTKEGYKSDLKEYFIVENNCVLNRKFYFNKEGDTLWHATKFNSYNQKEFIKDTLSSRISTMNWFKTLSKDTIFLGEKFLAVAEFNTPIIRKKNAEIILLLSEYESDLDNRFSNFNKVKFDTFYNLNYEKKLRRFYHKDYWAYTVFFYKKFKTSGQKVLSGYVKEYSKNDERKTNLPLTSYSLTYFQKKIFVKDTIN